jgi:hypothetical protein
MKSLLLFALLLPLLVVNSCKKIDSTGGHYMRCKVNGENVDLYPKPEGIQLYGANVPHVSFENDFKRLKIEGYDGATTVLNIYVDDTVNSLENRAYALSVNHTGSSFMSVSKSYSSYYTDSVNTGSVRLTIHKREETIEGTFSARLQQEKNGEIIEITEGVFYLNYH